METPTVQSEDCFFRLLEFAADNNLEGFKDLQLKKSFNLTRIGYWYCRRKGSKQIVLDQRTPLMVAATYGSVDVLRFILSQNGVDVNLSCGIDKITALHCAASGGSSDAIVVVQMLLKSGADLNFLDSNGCRAFDLIVVHPKLSSLRENLECLLSDGASGAINGGEKLSLVNESAPRAQSFQSEKKEYPFDPSLPDIKNSIYSTDEFRMYSFKVRPCSRAYSHDWTECPFVHPGENARRRDPRKFHYSCVPCPEFHKGTCRRGDICEYAHGVFECWLHPAQYRTRLCKDGTSCSRRVCFFAHTNEELRPLFVPSPRSSPAASVMDMAAALNLFPQPQSPPANGIPALHLPGSNLQTSRLRSSLNARDMMMKLAPSNLDDLFAAEHSSPRYGDQVNGVFSPSHKSAALNQFHHQLNTNPFSPKSVEHPFLQSPFMVGSPGRMSPRGIDPISPLSTRLSAVNREKQIHELRSLSSREMGSTNFGALMGSPVSSWPKWGSPNGLADWSINGDEMNKYQQTSFDHNEAETEAEAETEPDVSWVQSLVKESPEMMEKKMKPVCEVNSSGERGNLSGEIDSVIESWLEQMQMEKQQLVV